ncbi:MAG: HAMP domain-containing histidine kinase [Bryobacterales bacterium]|nr:HAMP domain-containing histidine kinase [Bryobacterales bacterium]
MPTPDLTLEGLVHDLRNVLETISDAADVISADPKHARLAGAIRRSVQRGTRMLTSFHESSLAQLDLDIILDMAIECSRDFMQAVKGPSIEFTRQIDSGVRLRGNPAAWERVFTNLFLNAGQAMEGDGAVSITARLSEPGLEVVVEDNGPGISPKILPRIFEPHFSTRAKRSGLGLHIVRTIVVEHGGEITASNRPSGQGAMFRISLPRV